jgi:serine/threonine-protein kinase
VLALGVVGFFVYQVLIAGPAAPQTVAIPAVANMSEADARTQIQAAGLRLGESRPQESSVEQKDQVLNTDPPAGTVVDERSLVTLIVGSGPASVTVPRLEGKTLQEAQQATSDSSLINHVIDSTPKAGESVKGGDSVAVIIGIQQTGVKVPDVSGQDLDDAVRALEGEGLRAQVPDNADDSDKVTGTDPAAGTVVQPNSQVELLTGGSSDGEAVMPDLVGRREEQAKGQLAELGFQSLSIRRQQVSSSSDVGRVLDQSVQAGDRVSTDQQITLTIGEASGSGSGLVN